MSRSSFGHTRKGGIALIENERDRIPQRGAPSSLPYLRTAIAEFARLYDARRGALEDDGPLLLSANHLASTLYYTVPIEHDADLERLVLETGVCDLYQDVIMNERFFTAPTVFADSVLQGLARVVLCCLVSQSLSIPGPLLRRAPLLWKSIWDRHPQLFRHASQDYQPVPLMRDNDFIVADPTVDLLWAYNQLFIAKTGSRSAPSSSFIPHVAFYYLVGMHEEDDVTSRDITGTTQTSLDECLIESTTDETATNHLVRQVLFTESGSLTIDAFAERFNRELDRFPLEVESVTRFPKAYRHMETFRRLAGSPPVFAALRAHATHPQFVRVMSQVLRSQADAQNVKAPVWITCSGLSGQLMQALIDTVEEPGAKLEIYVRAEDLVGEMARAVDLLCQEGSKLGPLRGNAPGMRLEILIERRLFDVNRLVGLLKADRVRKEDANIFVQSAKVAAAVEWWPSLRALQTVQYRASATPQRDMFRGVIRQWTALGTLLNFNEEKERKRHERESKRRCSWYACAYHRVDADASVVLGKCGGCGESHYCSHICQKDDWNKGGHKQQCRRLKSSAGF